MDCDGGEVVFEATTLGKRGISPGAGVERVRSLLKTCRTKERGELYGDCCGEFVGWRGALRKYKCDGVLLHAVAASICTLLGIEDKEEHGAIDRRWLGTKPRGITSELGIAP